MMLKGAVPGIAGSLAGWFLTAEGHLSTIGIATVTGVSCIFGMLSSMSRLEVIKQKAIRQLLMNAGAVWLSAFIIAAKTDPEITTAAMIGLGVGLAGTKILEIMELGVLTLTYRLTGVQPVEKQDLEEKIGDVNQKLGDVRQEAQKAVSEVRLQIRNEHKTDQTTYNKDAEDRWDDPQL